MKSVVLQQVPEATIIDVSHGVSPYDVRQGAWMLKNSNAYLPAGCTVLAVVDPGVGTSRAPVAVAAGERYYVGPDNGLLGWLQTLPDVRAVRISKAELTASRPGSTFHGRDIFAPAAAFLMQGGNINELGSPIQLIRLAPSVAAGEKRVTGMVVHVDNFGNLITELEPNDFAAAGLAEADVQVMAAGQIFRHVRTFGNGAPGEGIWYWGSAGGLELAMKEDNLARKAGLGLGDTVIVTEGRNG